MVVNRMMRHPEAYIKPAEALAAIAVARSRGDEQAALYLQVLSETGRRPCEILGQTRYEMRKVLKHPHPPMRGICPEDIDEVKGTLTCRIAKKRDTQLVTEVFPIRRELAIALMQYARAMHIRPNQEIFPFTIRTGLNIVKRYCQHITSKTFKLNQKAFRHGWAKAAAENSTSPADILAIKAQLSHNSLATTYEYLSGMYNEQKLRRLLHEMLNKEYREE